MSGERKGPLQPASIVAFAAAMNWQFLALTTSHATAALAQPLGHKDPFDELLLIQAQEEGMRLLTRDSKMVAHPIAISVRAMVRKGAEPSDIARR
jgi:PIN domain nuclease of toxin-antitoxin system